MPRSDPLVLKNGEPKNPPITYEKYPAWKVVIVQTETDKRASKKVFSYQVAKQTAAALQEKHGESAKVGVVSRQVGYGPPYSRVTNQMLLDANDHGLWWCPYCRNFREFHYVPYLDMKWCEFCHTREMDFHVVKCNPILWSPDVFHREFGK